jgi:anthranilate phosphoribosyltransferase
MASNEFKRLLTLAASGQPLDRDAAREAFEIMMSGEASPAQIGAFLMALRVRGETVDEIAAGAEVMRAKALAVAAPADAIDTCGTGGDAAGTLNISTAAAFVVAGCGVPVAKHGNKAQSSRSGSADVLAALGISIDLEPDTIARCIREAGIGFMFAQRHHGAMRHVGPVRVELGTRTIFNLLGPLSNPAGARRQLLGVFAKQWTAPLAEVLRRLGSDKVWVVHGSDGLDELTTTGASHVAELRDGTVRTFEVAPEDVGLTRADASALKGADPETNALALEAVLEGRPGAYRDIVLLNAAASLVVADRAGDLREGVALAARAIDDGAASERLAKLRALARAPEAVAP